MKIFFIFIRNIPEQLKHNCYMYLSFYRGKVVKKIQLEIFFLHATKYFCPDHVTSPGLKQYLNLLKLKNKCEKLVKTLRKTQEFL